MGEFIGVGWGGGCVVWTNLGGEGGLGFGVVGLVGEWSVEVSMGVVWLGGSIV